MVGLWLVEQYVQHITSEHCNALLVGMANSMNCPFQLHLYDSSLMSFVVEWYYVLFPNHIGVTGYVRRNIHRVGNTPSVTIRSSQKSLLMIHQVQSHLRRSSRDKLRFVGRHVWPFLRCCFLVEWNEIILRNEIFVKFIVCTFYSTTTEFLFRFDLAGDLLGFPKKTSTSIAYVWKTVNSFLVFLLSKG